MTKTKKPLTREQFEKKDMKRSDWTDVAEYRKHIEIVPCACGEPQCRGWKAVPIPVRKRSR